MLQQLRVEVLERVFERIGLGSRDRALDDGLFDTRRSEVTMEKLHGIAKTTSIVASECPEKRDGRLSVVGSLSVLVDRELHLVLGLELWYDFVDELGGFEILNQRWGAGQHQFVIIGYHSLRGVSLRDVQSRCGIN